ncbi:MAG: FAD-dependent oxidoreductase [Parvularculaceae bacterium]
MTKTIKTDICIIGAGSGGLSVAAGAAQLGKKVVLIEAGEMGGDCLNYGCIPSKAILAAGKTAQIMREADKYGVASVEPQVNFAAVHEHIHGVIDAIAPMDSQSRFEGFGITVLRDKAKFIGPRTVEAGDTTVSAKFIVIATGSSPFVPPIPGLDSVPYITNETIWERRELVDHLVVIGGGPIGIEMAQAHRRLGADVTVIEGLSIMGKDDPELVDIVRARLIDEGITILEGAMVKSVAGEAGAIKVIAEQDGSEKTIQGSHILVATGRRPNVADLNLEAAGIDYSKRGIKVDGALRTSNKRIYAAGDVTGGRQFTHVAGYHAGIIIKKMLFKAPAKNEEHLAPWVTYTDPELAHVGLTQAQAVEKGLPVTIAKWGFDHNDRAQAEHATNGLIKVVTDKKGKILGCSIVGKNAGDLIGPWALAYANGMKIGAFTKMIAPYPTLGEVSKRAAGAWYTPKLFSDRTKGLIKALSIFD